LIPVAFRAAFASSRFSFDGLSISTPLEADLLGQLELVLNGLALADHGVLHGLAELGLLGRVGEDGAGQQAGGRGEEGAAVHGESGREGT
jgi:hypothetical protein